MDQYNQSPASGGGAAGSCNIETVTADSVAGTCTITGPCTVETGTGMTIVGASVAVPFERVDELVICRWGLCLP